jgi:hypothetical protein
MATRPDKEPQEPLQPGNTDPQPTHFPDPMKTIPEPSPDPFVPPQD